MQVRAEAVRTLVTAHEERRRADAEAAAARERRDRDAASRSAALLAEVAALEHRRSLLRAEIERLAVPVADPAGGRPAVPVRLLGRIGWRARSLRAP
jgi:hypothetical protein